MSLDLVNIKSVLSTITVKGLDKPLSEFVVAAQRVNDSDILLSLSIPLADDLDLMAEAFEAVLTLYNDIDDIEFSFDAPVAPVQGKLEALEQVKNTVVVASGKGGVGKSTTAVNIALALKTQGARVAILDADIYGPSVQLMLGVSDETRPGQYEGKYFVPVPAHGLQSMSMAYLVTDKTPVVWRGPMASGALQQMLKQTRWQDIDYLIIDMPPGTGDIQLTLSQQLPVTGSVIVTTPQNMALLDAQKGIEMFRKVGIPVLGVVENMSYHKCSECGHEDQIFGAGAGNSLSKDYEAPLLGNLPLLSSIRAQTDEGVPTVIAAPESTETQAYKRIARRLAAALVSQAKDTHVAPTIEITDE